jgi:hypothetical protein
MRSLSSAKLFAMSVLLVGRVSDMGARQVSGKLLSALPRVGQERWPADLVITSRQALKAAGLAGTDV